MDAIQGLNISSVICILLSIVFIIIGITKKILKKVIIVAIIFFLAALFMKTYSINLDGGDWFGYLKDILTPLII